MRFFLGGEWKNGLFCLILRETNNDTAMKKFLIALGLVMMAAILPCEAQYSRSMSRHYNTSRNRSYGDLVELFVTSPGELADRMPKNMYDRVRVLRIEGPLNEADFKYITKLAKRSKVVNENGKEVDNFLDVDLELARAQEKSLLGTNYDVLPHGAFEYASHLRSVVLPERLKKVGSSAFHSCYYLEEVILPPRVVELGDYAFEGCSELRYFTLPTSLETIGQECFDGCKALRQLALPHTMRFIGKNAFNDSGVTELFIPAYCEIEEGGLGFMNQLQSIEVESGNSHFSSYDHSLYDRDGRTLLLYPAGRTGECRLLSGVQSIDAKAFYKSKVTAVEVPTSVTSLGKEAFAGCDKLVSVWLPDGVTELPAKVFNDCTSLRDIEMGAIDKMGESAFNNCHSLQSFTLVGALSVVPKCAFENCKNLQRVELPQSVTTIGEKAFHECNALADLVLSERLTTLGKQAFDRCYALESVDLPDGVTAIDEKVFFECKGLRSVKLGNRVQSIGKEAFRRCKALTDIELPSSVITIDKEAFRECTSLGRIDLNEGLKSIGDNALRETAIQQLSLPSTISKVGKNVAEKCKSLQRIDCKAVVPPELDALSSDKVQLFVPASSVEAYKNAKNWKKFKSINPL